MPKNIVTVHAPDHSYPVYCNPCWWSDRWDPLKFGSPYDSSRSFLKQYSELLARVPQRAMVNDDGVMSENCAYTFDVAFSRNCYLCFGMWKSQDCLYCRICDQSKFCVDCEGVKLGSELVYESVDSQRLYRCAFLQNCENCLGDHLFHCRNVLGYVSTNAEHSRWIERSDGPLWCYDQIQCGSPELCYECITNDNGYMVLFSLYCNQSHYTLYSDNCVHCDNLFGCISLRRKKYCILNTQYSKEEYEKLAGSIIEKMQEDGTFGEFFPIAMSPYGYNETNAAEFFPRSEEEIKKHGWKWCTDLPYTTGKETLKSENMPDEIAAIPDAIVKEVLACSSCKKNYRIIPQELSFYRSLNVPIPDNCPDCRNRKRLSHRNPQRLWEHTCKKCEEKMYSTYSPDRPETIYCEKCYLKTVY